LKCNSCHPSGKILPEGSPINWGPDLSLTQHRLQGEWVKKWLRSPASYLPGTKMPQFFYDDKMNTLLWNAWKTEEQIENLKNFLLHMDKANSLAK
jgi:cbb3-type cytochrome oxidase cytochrome c subunit